MAAEYQTQLLSQGQDPSRWHKSSLADTATTPGSDPTKVDGEVQADVYSERLNAFTVGRRSIQNPNMHASLTRTWQPAIPILPNEPVHVGGVYAAHKFAAPVKVDISISSAGALAGYAGDFSTCVDNVDQHHDME
jgi:hypothetical protein